MSDSSAGQSQATGDALDENPYQKVLLDGSEREPEPAAQRRPASLSADIKTPPRAPLPPLEEAPGAFTEPPGQSWPNAPIQTPPPAPAPNPVDESSWEAPAPSPGLLEKFATIRQERPELIVIAAFAGGLALATLLKKLGSR